MSYEPKEWQCGDTITAEDLNRMEQGIAQGGGGSELLVIEIDTDENAMTMNKTWQEINDAFPYVYSVTEAFGETNKSIVITVCSIPESDEYMVETNNLTFTADSPDGYPSYSNE